MTTEPIFNEVLKQIAIFSLAANAVLAYFGFKLVSFYMRQIGKLEDKYTNLAEMRDTTKIEDVMTTLERDIKAQNYRHEQEMMSAFNTLKSFVDKYAPHPGSQYGRRSTDSNQQSTELF